jgi:3-oxoacyl-[acyl-carrier-protein] synthase-3
MQKKAKIIGTGSYVPENVLTNRDLETLVDTSDEWIVTRTGMKERRIAKNDEYTSDMGLKAAKAAIENAGINKDQVDCIIFATLTPDYPFPSTACLIQHMLELKECAAFDIQAACSGYIYALSIAKAYVESGQYHHVLLIASEKLSSVTNYSDRNTCVLFGDGAAACIISLKEDGLDITEICLGADGSQAGIIKMPAGGVRNPASLETVANKQHYIFMEGKEVFKHAVRRMEMACVECLQKACLQSSQVSWLIPHQANIRIIEFMAKRFDVPMQRVFITIHKYGNTSCSSVGIALDELLREKQIKHDEHILLTAFGSGLAWGATILTKKEGK